MKKLLCVLLALALLALAACGKQDGAVPETETGPFPMEQTVEGFTPDGASAVRLTIRVNGVTEGEAAFEALQAQNAQLPPPDEGKEYCIVYLTVTYEDGELEELSFFENYPASLASARVRFNLPNEKSNPENVTWRLENPIWDHILAKGESASGAVAFLQEAGNTQPLYFEGYGQAVTFPIH